jgi:hypothetical protein
LAYAAKRGEKWVLVVDRVESNDEYDMIPRGAKVTFVDNQSFHIVAFRAAAMEFFCVKAVIVAVGP